MKRQLLQQTKKIVKNQKSNLSFSRGQKKATLQRNLKLTSIYKNAKSANSPSAKGPAWRLRTKQKQNVVQNRKKVAKSKKTLQIRAQTRNTLSEPVGNGLFLADDNRSNMKETIYPSDAYQQVENYVNSVLQNSIQSPANLYQSSVQREQKALERNAVFSPATDALSYKSPFGAPYSNKLSNPQTVSAIVRNSAPVPPSPPPLPPPPPVPAPAPLMPPAPAPAPVPAAVTAPAPAPVPAAVTAPAPAPVPIPAPGPASVQAPIQIAPPAEASASTPILTPNDKGFQETGQVVDVPGPNGKPMKYYIQSYTSEIVPDGKGGYKEIMTNPPDKDATQSAPVQATPVISPNKKSKNLQHRAKINDCTIAIGNRSEEQPQASKRVYSLGGHGEFLFSRSLILFILKMTSSI